MLWYVVDVVSKVVGFGGTQCHVCGMRRHGVEGDGNRFEWRKDREKEEKGKKREREKERERERERERKRIIQGEWKRVEEETRQKAKKWWWWWSGRGSDDRLSWHGSDRRQRMDKRTKGQDRAWTEDKRKSTVECGCVCLNGPHLIN